MINMWFGRTAPLKKPDCNRLTLIQKQKYWLAGQLDRAAVVPQTPSTQIEAEEKRKSRVRSRPRPRASSGQSVADSRNRNQDKINQMTSKNMQLREEISSCRRETSYYKGLCLSLLQSYESTKRL
jgi:hypothetical protein